MSKSNRTRQQLLDELQLLTSRMVEAESNLRSLRVRMHKKIARSQCKTR